MVKLSCGLALALCLAAGGALAAEAPERVAERLERVVIVMRHGVRPPTKSAAALAPLADRPWPDDAAWGAVPGELTPHGAQAIERLGAEIVKLYPSLIAAPRSLPEAVMIWADGADQRTRETAKALARGLSPAAPLAIGAAGEGATDPLFDALDAGVCALDPTQAKAALDAQAPFETPAVRSGLARLQQILAPNACAGGAGTCLDAPAKASADPSGAKLSGGLGAGAGLAEDLLLEWENGLSGDQLGAGRLTRPDLDTVMAVHRRASELTRRTPYIALRRGGPLAAFILAALEEGDTPAGTPRLKAARKLVVLVGHDTNLSNLAGVFGLDWTLPDQPDVTAPGTALAFERWREVGTGRAVARLRVIYEDADAVRALRAPLARTATLQAGDCGGSSARCALEPWASRAKARIAAACPAALATRR
jgi:4-phytase/acid phosphatase